MNEIQQLYQKIILDHHKNPKNYGTLESPTHELEKDNPICGDRIHLDLKMHGFQVEEIRFTGMGCALCIASASMMTELTVQQNLEEIEELLRYFKEIMDPEGMHNDAKATYNDNLQAFEGIRKYPSRIQCATLPWEALLQVRKLIENRGEATI
ncbi:MAG: SUF system NifU family Fe-S cluster assembly protein [SAR324 cluster bacterium]|nr:SUF system NifU family Fe-S cluster assembly protein [SAR324 cluster bacterium]